ncbi:purine nucleoside phosphorylase DeoD-type [Lachnospiraceae bacterium]|nr:purine nucleoside phosphorylase DeoD-type [Lachnospiraceae bacterium]
MIHETLDLETEPLFTPEAFYGKHEKICDVCVVTFSYKVMEWALQHLECEQVAEIGCCNGDRPIYLTEWKGKKIAFYMTMVSAPGAASCLEEVLCLTGCREYVVFGSCGTLNRQLTEGRLIVPAWAYRDEGLSYHYIAASEYIEMKDWKKVADFLEKKGLPYVTGRTWTTDALYRETSGKAGKMRKDGCIAVEMELAGMQAVCTYHGLILKAFLFASDCLGTEEWHNELLGSEREWDTQVKCFLLALDLAS